MIDVIRERLVRQIEDILYEVQYAPMGQKSSVRKKKAVYIVDSILAANEIRFNTKGK